jgi:hypothetical protein
MKLGLGLGFGKGGGATPSANEFMVKQTPTVDERFRTVDGQKFIVKEG